MRNGENQENMKTALLFAGLSFWDYGSYTSSTFKTNF